MLNSGTRFRLFYFKNALLSKTNKKDMKTASQYVEALVKVIIIRLKSHQRESSLSHPGVGSSNRLKPLFQFGTGLRRQTMMFRWYRYDL